MPAKHTVKYYKLGGYYHLFNRGTNRQSIFIDEQDYRTFEYYLQVYLAPLKKTLAKYPRLSRRLKKGNLSEDVELLSYCLMPNHFHLLVQLHWMTGASSLMKRVANAYTRYFNRKYDRVGPLFQGAYKAVELEGRHQAMQVSRYIHRNPYDESLVREGDDYAWSSMTDYRRNRFRSFISRNLLVDCKLSPTRYVNYMYEINLDGETNQHLFIEQ